MAPYNLRGSWYSQLPPFGWFDPGDKPGSNALGVPDWQQGIALPSRRTLGQWYNVTPPGATIPYPFQQTDTGPASWTGRGVDISAAAAQQMGYTPQTFPTDAQFKIEPRDEPRGLGSPAGLPVQAGDLPDNSAPDAYASGPSPARKSMPANLMDMFSGGLTPTDAVTGQPTDFGNAIAQNRNALVGLGMGLLQPRSLAVGAPPQSAWTNALSGYQQGAQSDAANANRQQLLRLQIQDRLFKQQEAARAQANTNRSFTEGVRQFEVGREIKPTIHWQPYETETGEKGATPFLVNPNGTYRELTKEGVQNLTPTLQQTGAVPGAPTAATPGQQTSDETAIPSTATAAQATPPTLPLNRREAIKQYSHKYGEQQAAEASKSETAGKVFGMLDQLEKKTSDPLFAQAAGPTREYASGQPVWNPARAIYEYSPLGPSEKAKTFLDTIKADASAINSELQRAYLTGQGSVTVQERAQINQILGNIAAARSPESAREMLRNVRGLITAAFQKGYAVPGAAAPGASAGGSGDPLAEARQAIANGAPRDAVIKRLRENKIDPSGL